MESDILSGLSREGPEPVGQARRHWPIRSLRNWFCLFCLILLLGVIGILAIGGRPDPAGSGQVLDGSWRFRPGDNPAWAGPRLDDRSWDQIQLISRPENNDGDVGIPGFLDGWRARGHPKLVGYGWYRRQVTLPPHGDLVLVGPPVVDDGYEMFWDGRRIGGIGKLSGSPRVGITRPKIAALPTSSGERVGLLAIRAYMQPGNRDGQSGGLRTAPVLASKAEGEALYRAQWNRTIAGYIVEVAEPAAMLVLAIIALLVAPRLTNPAFGRWLALGLTATACLRLGNAIIAWTDLLSLTWLSWQNRVVLAPLTKLAWTIAWNQSTSGRDRRLVSLAAGVGYITLVAGALAHSQIVDETGRALIAIALLAIAIRVIRHGEHRLLGLTAMLLTSVGLFASDFSTLGVPGIWFPFNIGVSRSQFAYALALPLLAFVLARATQEEADEANRSEEDPRPLAVPA